MSAYWIVRMNVTAPEAYEEYKKRTASALTKYGGRFIVRGGRTETVEGEEDYPRVVVVEFPSYEQALKCYDSPEYQEAKRFREGAADAQIIVVDGV